jgi:opacity protein-like surface antigen
MTKKLLFVVTIALALAFVAMAADATGKWTFEQQGRGGRGPTQQTITLKQDGSKLTGSVPGFGRGGDNPPPPTEITDAKVDGNKVSFTVKREFNGNVNVTKYEGEIDGDTMKLKITRNGQNGETTTEVTAKRSTT